MGCALFDADASPLEKYAAAQETYIVLVGSLVTARDLELIDADDFERDILPIILEGDALLDRMEVMVLADEIDEVELLRQSLIGIILRLQAARL